MSEHRRRENLRGRVIKAAECLTGDDRTLIATALRFAAEQYEADAVQNDQASARVAHHFEEMALNCQLIANAIEL